MMPDRVGTIARLRQRVDTLKSEITVLNLTIADKDKQLAAANERFNRLKSECDTNTGLRKEINSLRHQIAEKVLDPEKKENQP